MPKQHTMRNPKARETQETSASSNMCDLGIIEVRITPIYVMCPLMALITVSCHLSGMVHIALLPCVYVLRSAYCTQLMS